MADNNDALFREVEEELARERWEKLWKQYGSYIVAAAALIVALVGGKQWWDSHQRTLSETASAKYEQALALVTAGKAEEGQQALADLAATGPAGYAALAEFNLVGANLKAGKMAEALAILDKLATKAPDPLLANYARLQAAALELGSADYSKVQNRLEGLTVDSSPWRIPARELLGMAAFKAGKTEEARSLLTGLLGEQSLSREASARITTVLASITTADLAKAPAADATPPATAPAAAPAGAPAN